ncbi:MAG: SunT [Solirubrobacterales bacterium]|nr:SunT [Solirubrobacterales bacterium]
MIAAGARRVHTPSVYQVDPVECGAVALAIVLGHHGRYVSVEELRQACGVSRDGSRAGNIARAARSYGLTAKGIRLEPSDLTEVVLPLIVYWEFNHFVVVEGYGPKGVHLNDPAMGLHTVSWDEFDRAFTGVAIAMEPGSEFARAGSPPSVTEALRSRLTGARGPLALCVLAGLGLLAPALLLPAAVRIFVDEYLVAGDRKWLLIVIVGASLAAIAQFVLTWLQQITLLRLALRLSMTLSTSFFEHVLALPLTFFGQRHASAVVTKVGDNFFIASLLSSQLATCLFAAMTSVLYLGLMVVYDWQLTLVALAFAAGNVVALRAGARRRRDFTRLTGYAIARTTATAIGGIQNIETIKATSEEDAFFARWSGEQARVVTRQQNAGARAALLASFPPLLAALSVAVLLGVGGLQVMDGQISLGTLAAFQLLAVGFAAPLGQLVGFGRGMEEAAGKLSGLDDVLTYPADPEAMQRPIAAGTAARLSGALELDDVTFGYNRLEPPLIEGLSLRLEPGQRVAIVGPSGSGKSTVARLVTGLHQPWEGEIRLDGIPRREIPRGVLAATLAYVDQDIRLFEGTVRDNLTLWDPTFDGDEITRAGRDAAIHDDVLRRPGGYDRPIEEGGRDWSGGQRQRIEIARALAGDPALLVLDEATSALDPIVEHAIDRALRARGCACLIVAHRLSTIRDCDEILVLDGGRVVERGTHEELVARGGLYVELVGE